MGNDEIAAYGRQLMEQNIAIREEEARAAQKVVAGKARDVEDARELLDALGLI
jgi:hypothetical protein